MKFKPKQNMDTCMCFIVMSSSPIDDEWQQRDEEIFGVAGRSPNYSSTDSGSNKKSIREHGWLVETLEEAVNMRKRLEKIPYVISLCREK